MWIERIVLPIKWLKTMKKYPSQFSSATLSNYIFGFWTVDRTEWEMLKMQTGDCHHCFDTLYTGLIDSSRKWSADKSIIALGLQSLFRALFCSCTSISLKQQRVPACYYISIWKTNSVMVTSSHSSFSNDCCIKLTLQPVPQHTGCLRDRKQRDLQDLLPSRLYFRRPSSHGCSWAGSYLE